MRLHRYHTATHRLFLFRQLALTFLGDGHGSQMRHISDAQRTTLSVRHATTMHEACKRRRNRFPQF